MSAVPVFPGNTAVSELEVYQDVAPDGIRGGSPHLHTVSTESYVVVGGSGVLHTVSVGDGGAPLVEAHPLHPGEVVWFAPGTIHRAENTGGLRVIVVMANSGLPEAGDAVMTFPREVLQDPAAYAAAATLPQGDHAARTRAAAARRDLAVTGYRQLLDDIDARGAAALVELHDRAVALVSGRTAAWRERFAATERLTAATAGWIDAVEAGSANHLARAAVSVSGRPAEQTFGMCGLLRPAS